MNQLLPQEHRGSRQFLETIIHLGEILGSQTPTVIFIDNIQWADIDTLQILKQIGQHWAEHRSPVLLLLGINTEEIMQDSQQKRWYAHTLAQTYTAKLSLSPLTIADTVRFVRALNIQPGPSSFFFIEGFGHWLYTETQGHPLYLIQLLQTLIE